MTDHDAEPAPQTLSDQKIRILLVDDHPLVRQGLRMFIELQEDMQVVGEASTGAQAVELAAHLQPDVILLDLVMPGMDGVEATRRILACSAAKDAQPVPNIGGDFIRQELRTCGSDQPDDASEE